MALKMLQTKDGVSFTVKAVPGSSKTSIEGLIGDMLKVKLAAPPEKGKANKELISYLSKLLSIKKNDIKIVSGQSNPVKSVEVCNCPAEKIKNLI